MVSSKKKLNFFFSSSVLVHFLHHLEGLLVSNHAFVSAFYFVQKHNVYVRSGALLETSWHYHTVKEVCVHANILEFVVGS